MPQIVRVCQNPTCQQEFYIAPWQESKGRYTYCTHLCYWEDRQRFVEERFWAKVKKSSEENGCWEWIGARHTFGYGKFQLTTKTQVAAYRFAYERYVEAIPEGFFVCHRCDNPPCVRPDHLFVGTQSDNIKDAYTKGRIYAMNGPGEKNRGSKLSDSQVLFIRENQGKIPGIQLARIFHVHHGTIYSIWHRRSWIHLD